MKKVNTSTDANKSSSARERFAAAACRKAAAELEKIIPLVAGQPLVRNIADVEIELRYIASILDSGPVSAATKSKKGTP